MDLINISSIFRDFEVQKLIPPYFDNMEMPTISYSYKKPTRNLIFNFSSITSDMKIEENYPRSCDCEHSPYIYKPCGHIITGELNFVEDREAKQFLMKGPKYRAPSKINWKACHDSIHDAISNYCVKWCKRECADKHALDAFKNKVLNIVDRRVQYYKANYQQTSKNKLSVPRIKHKLCTLSKSFAFVPADKAANNVVIV